MAPPKQEKVAFINIRVPLSRYKEIKRITKAIGASSATEFSRQVIYAAVEEHKRKEAA